MSNLPNISDELSIFRMEMLTWFGKMILPKGEWLGTAHDTNGEKADGRTLYLTYDDGPCPETTPQLLEYFEKEEVKATFFVVGAHAEKEPALLKQVAKAGHTIGNHGHNHQLMPLLTSAQMRDQILRANQTIESICKVIPQYFRAPYGVLDERGARCLREAGLAPVYWGAVSEDWLPIGAERVVARVKRKLSDGALIVLHEGWFPQQTVEATKEIVRVGREAGYRFAALPVKSGYQARL